MAISWSLYGMAIFINGASTFNPIVPGYTDFTSLFDQYQIKHVRCDVFWSKNIAGEGTAAYSLPLLWSALDMDDPSAITKSELQQYPNVRTTSLGENGGKVFTESFRPVARMSVPDGAGGTGYAPNLDTNIWLDCSYDRVAHYGLKLYLETFGRASNIDIGSFLVVSHITYGFRNQR